MFSSILSKIKKNKKGIAYIIFGLILVSIYTYESVIQGLNKREDGWHGKDHARSEFIKNSRWPSKANLKHKIWLGFEELKKNYLERPSDTVAMKKYADFLFESHRGEYAIPIYEDILEINPLRKDISLRLFKLYDNFYMHDKLINRFFYNDSLLQDLREYSKNPVAIDSITLKLRYIISQRE